MTPPQRPSNPGDRYALTILMFCIVSVFRYQVLFVCFFVQTSAEESALMFFDNIIKQWYILNLFFPLSAYVHCIKLFIGIGMHLN